MKYKLRDNFRTDENAIYDILRNRGIQDVEKYIHPTKEQENNPYDLENIEAAADMLIKHLKNNNSICIVVDADNDGVCSAAMLWNYIKTIFPNSDLNYVMHEGKAHGLEDKIDWFIDDTQYDLIICPDAASYDVKYFWRLFEINTEVIALDHHTQMYDTDGKPIINDCPTAIVVNNQLSPKYKNKDFCGAGITYRFCNVLDDKFNINISHNFVDLAAVGNIGDVMYQGDPETRFVIKDGLAHIQNEGLKTMIKAQSYSLKERADPPYSLTPIDVAFYISPLINAVIRVGTMDEKHVLFTAFIDPNFPFPSTKRGAKSGDIELAKDQAARISKNIKSRQDKIKERALDLIKFRIEKDNLSENNLIIVEIYPEDNIPNEISGLIAQNIVSEYNKPCFIVRRNSKNILSGSLRNNGNFKDLPELKSVLEKTGLFEMLAGHENAAGVSIAANRVPSLLQFMNNNFGADAFDNCYLVDYILDGRNDNISLLWQLAECSDYYGNGIDEPKFIIKNIPLNNMLVMGENKDCVKISYKGIDYVKFKNTDFIDDLRAHRLQLLTVYGRAALNTYMGHTSIQLLIDDYELEEDNSKYEF